MNCDFMYIISIIIIIYECVWISPTRAIEGRMDGEIVSANGVEGSRQPHLWLTQISLSISKVSRF